MSRSLISRCSDVFVAVSLSSSDVNAIAARSQAQLDKVRARASEHSNKQGRPDAASSTLLSGAGDDAREEVAERVARATQRGSEFVQALANEPSVGLFHVQAHVLRTLPKWTELQRDLSEHVALLDRHRLDVEYSTGVVEQIVELNSFAALLALSRRSVELVDQLRAMPPRSRRPSSTQP
jgi:hypothetical protein